MTKISKTISIANDFTLTTGARYRSDGKFSGQEFYEDKLKPEMDLIWSRPNSILMIDFDGTYGYASSFISEVFLRVAKDFKLKDKILKKLVFKSEDDPYMVETIKEILIENCQR